MTTALFESTIIRRPADAIEFLAAVLQAFTEYSIIGMDLEGRILLWNEGARRLYGYEPAEVVGRADSSILFTPEDREEGKPREITAASLLDGKWEGTVNRVRKNGDRFTAHVVIIPRKDVAGQPVGFLLISKDISDEIRLSDELKATQVYTRSLFDSNIDALMTTDPVGIITDANPQMEALTGRSRMELIGTEFKRYFTDPVRAEAGIRIVLREGRVTNYELTALSRDGRTIVVSYNASIFRDATGRLQGVFAAARDITVQTALEHRLRDSEAYSRGLIETSVDGLLTVDAAGAVIDANEQMIRMTGLPREELIGTPFSERFVDPDRATAGVQETFEKGVVRDYEAAIATGDDRRLRVSFNAKVFRDPSGEVRGIFGSARDITEQATLKSQLAEERAHNRGLIEASVDGLITVDAMLIITDVSESTCKMTGFTRTELVGMPFHEFFTDSSKAAAGVRLTLDRGTLANYELTLRTRDRRERLISLNAAVFKHESGSIRGIFASARDITEQARLQALVTEERAFNREGFIESSVDALVTVDEQMMITEVNETMCTMVGRRRNEEPIGSSFPNYFAERDRATEGVRLALRDGSVTDCVLTFRAANGHELPVSLYASAFKDSSGQVRGIVASARDITAQRQLEHKLHESQQNAQSLIDSNADARITTQKLERQLLAQQAHDRGLIASSVDGLVTVDPAGIIVDVNARMMQMTGRERAELVGAPFAACFTDPELAQAGVVKTLADSIVTEHELTLVSRTRRPLHVSFNASIFRDPADDAVLGIFVSVRDIGDRVRLEEQLREQQMYLRGLIETSGDGLVTVDPDGFIIDVNEQMCRMTEHAREALIGLPFKQCFADQGRADIGTRRAFAEGKVSGYELVLRTRTGKKTTIAFTATSFRDDEGRAKGIFASAHDISEQARLQAQLTEQRAYNRSLIDASPDAQFAIAPDGIITDVNEGATRLTGYSRKLLINSRFENYFTDPARARAGAGQALAERRVIGFELDLITRHDRRIPVSFNAGVFTDAGGRPLSILAAVRDISVQKELDRQLRDQQFYTRSLFESNIDASMATDPLGIITDVNQQMESLTGCTRDELIGSPFKTYFTDPARAEEGIRRVLREGRVNDYELNARSKNGSETMVSYNAATIFDRDGKLQGVFVAARDVAERKRFEKALQEKNVEDENASLAKDRFLATMSHELRTPLNAIIGFTGTLIMKLPGPLTPDQDKQLRTVQGSARHLLSLINDLLDLAKIESGKVEMLFESVDCEDVIRDVVRTLRPAAEAKGLKFNVDIAEPGQILRTDRRALSQILINLLNNAIKFTDTGEVRIQLASETRDGTAMTAFRVVDSGIGMKQEDQPRLFEAFQQIRQRGHVEGTGLGLHLSQKLAAILGARIEFMSEFGKGSTFTLSLPRN